MKKRTHTEAFEEADAAAQSGALHTRLKAARASHKRNTALVVASRADEQDENDSSVNSEYARTSSLIAPNVQFKGHEGGVMITRFDNSGEFFASAGNDRKILIWNTFGDPADANCAILTGAHKNAIFDIAWSYDNEYVVSGGADNLCVLWDVETGTAIKRIKDHTKHVNSVDTTRRGEPIFLSASDSGDVMLHDMRAPKSPFTKLTHQYPVTSAKFSDDGHRLFAAGIDNSIYCWDYRAGRQVYCLEGHSNTITDVAVSKDGLRLVSNSMDQSLRIWDINAYVSEEKKRLVSILQGHNHDYQKHMLRCSWAPDNNRVACGSANGLVNVWNVHQQKLLYSLPGHQGTVFHVDFHPTEPIIASCGLDGVIFLGEINP